MGDTYSRILESSKEVWQLEQAQILINIEEEMSREERKTEREKYQLKIKDELFLQVYMVDEDHFGKHELKRTDRIEAKTRGHSKHTEAATQNPFEH